MEIDIIFKIAAIGIAVAVLNQVLIKAGREEQAMLNGRRLPVSSSSWCW
ncbi:MAG: SpoIIIAC/SpoIIIAD family protein [Anaerovoracaceae bacterium]